MITLDKIYEKTNGGKDIFTTIRPELAKYFGTTTKFKYRTEEKTPSAVFRLSKTKQGTEYWRLVDYGDEPLSPFEFYKEERGYGYMSFYEVIKRLAMEFGVEEELSHAVNKPVVEYREARPDEPDYIYELLPEIPAAYLPVLGPSVTAYTCAQLNWHAAKFLGHRLKDGKMRIETPTDTYPILMRECKVPGKPSFYKVYKPLNPDKAYRFLYIGNKEQKYICGLEELKAACEAMGKASCEKEGAGESAQAQRVPRVFIMSGERDALCLQSLGEHALWFNSETYHISPEEIAEIHKYAEVIYNIPDIDETGRRKGAELALAHLNVRTVWLPNSLNDFNDVRGRKSKDFRDWMEIHRSRRDFELLIENAMPARFWYVEVDKNGREKVVVDGVSLYHFLQLNGFYTLRDTANNTPRIIRVEKNVIKDQFPKDVRRFIRDWAKQNGLPANVRNTFIHHPHLQDGALENLEEINPCFDDCTESSQLYYFRGKAINVTADGIKEYNGASIDSSHYVWESNVLQHSFRKMEPMFRVTHKADANGHIEWDIEIADGVPSNVFKYLINTSRIHWRKELESRFMAGQVLTPEENTRKQEYHRLNPFRIDGEGLTPEEIRDQKINLISKLQGIGYLFHHHKTRLHIWAPLLLDNKIGDNGQCNGRSGKSFLMKAISKLQDVMPMDGRNDKLMENNHVFGTVKESTRIISIDDCYERFDFNRFYSLISDDMTVNPKNQAQVTIPFERSAKFCFSSNFVPNDQNASSEARRFYMVFSDYYHMQSEENDYLETRTIQSDFHKELHSASYSEEEWNADINFFMQCLQFYLQLCREDMNIKIVPPMYNIMQRMRRQQMGVNFEEWADAYFSIEAGNLDRAIPRAVMFDDFRMHTNSTKTSAQKFKKQLLAYCQFAEHIAVLNPDDMLNSGNRILMRDSSRNSGKPEEYFYIRSVRADIRMKEEKAQQVLSFPEPAPSAPSPTPYAPTGSDGCPF